MRPETFRAALEELVAQKKLDVQGDTGEAGRLEHDLLPEEARAKEQIQGLWHGGAGGAGGERSAGQAAGGSQAARRRFLRSFCAREVLVRVSPELIFHSEALAQLRERFPRIRKTKGERISVPVFKELTGITRKYAIPLLEYLDREKVTRRAGDERVILQ